MTESSRRTIRDLVSARSAAESSGCPVELLQLETCLREVGPIVAWAHGPPGCGKSALINEFCGRHQAGHACCAVSYGSHRVPTCGD